MGKIKKGFSTFIGNAGEHNVMAELLKRGIIAALAPRNATAYDIIASNINEIEKTVRIRVKTKTEKYDIWQYSAKKDRSILRFLQDREDFTVLVHMSDDVKEMRFFIVPTKIINEWLVEDFNKWVRTPGKGGHKRSKESIKRTLKYSKHEEELEPFENNWDGLWM